MIRRQKVMSSRRAGRYLRLKIKRKVRAADLRRDFGRFRKRAGGGFESGHKALVK
jgi:hypothetical protein